jgi:hypothetical protein
MVVTLTQIDVLVKTVESLPPEAQAEVLHFAEFLFAKFQRTQLDDAWDAALESTTPEQAARIRARIASQRMQATPLFNDMGKVTPPLPSL